jgi:hypothetical protein
MYPLWLLLALTGLYHPLPPASAGCPKNGQPGRYSKDSIELCFQNVDTRQRFLEIPSPDRSVILVVNSDDADLRIAGRNVASFPATSDEEVLWSPDSRSLVVTSSFGASGPAVAYIKAVPSKGLRDVPDPTSIIRRDFAGRHHAVECSESVNVGGLGWIDGSRNVLLVAQIPTTPQCGEDWGYFDVYVMSIPEGKILRRYSMREALTRFKRFLGPGLRRDVPKLRQQRVAPSK